AKTGQGGAPLLGRTGTGNVTAALHQQATPRPGVAFLLSHAVSWLTNSSANFMVNDILAALG
ncbi:hypothetical protein, partial [Methylobacterium variabile]|uniref:hypothetical protein n=1 Tax=Methylobacterium variabile TaxID=298794 RepID=UPI001ADF0A14